MWTPYEDIMRRRWLPDITNMQDIPESLAESDTFIPSNNTVMN